MHEVKKLKSSDWIAFLQPTVLSHVEFFLPGLITVRLVVGLARPSQPIGIVSFQCPITLQHLIFDSSAEIRILDVTVEPSLGKGKVFTEY